MSPIFNKQVFIFWWQLSPFSTYVLYTFAVHNNIIVYVPWLSPCVNWDTVFLYSVELRFKTRRLPFNLISKTKRNRVDLSLYHALFLSVNFSWTDLYKDEKQSIMKAWARFKITYIMSYICISWLLFYRALQYY